MINSKILLVDDEEDFVTTLAERLRIRKFNTAIALDGESAVRMVEADRPDVIVVDLKMPGFSGLEVLKRVKAIDRTIQVILLTGHGSTKEGIEGMNLGAYDYLMKPIHIDELIEKMKEAMEKN